MAYPKPSNTDSLSFVWSFTPEPPQREITPVRAFYEPVKRKKGEPSWLAPEHVRLAQDMRRDYPRDELGRRIDGKPRELVLDNRPTVMRPERPTRLGWL
jgi:hypothetical protein